MTRDEVEKIERLIDNHGVMDVVHAVATICQDKSDYFSRNWREIEMAQAWAKVGRSLKRCAIEAGRLLA